MSRSKAAPEAEADHSKDWLLTYADMITLLTVFFILLYSMSIINDEKLQELAVSVRSGFGGQLKGQGKSISSGGSGPSSKLNLSPFQSLEDEVQAELRRSITEVEEQGLIEVRTNQYGEVVVSLFGSPKGGAPAKPDHIFFERGSADLSPAAVRAVQAVARALTGKAVDLQVQGHTCNLPIYTAQFHSNMELSWGRANAVAQILQKSLAKGGGRITPMGFGSKRPLKPNTSEANRRFNRRVDIVIRELHSDKADAPTADAPAAASEGAQGASP